jgi:hypothetical protein
MAFRHHALASLIVVDPAKAKRRIKEAFVEARGSREVAASLLGCKRATLLAWIRKLATKNAEGMTLDEELEGIEKIAKRDGWHHGRLGGAAWHRNRTR